MLLNLWNPQLMKLKIFEYYLWNPDTWHQGKKSWHTKVLSFWQLTKSFFNYYYNYYRVMMHFERCTNGIIGVLLMNYPCCSVFYKLCNKYYLYFIHIAVCYELKSSHKPQLDSLTDICLWLMRCIRRGENSLPKKFSNQWSDKQYFGHFVHTVNKILKKFWWSCQYLTDQGLRTTGFSRRLRKRHHLRIECR